MEEGVTLGRTLLPYLNKVRDYSFVTSDSFFIHGRFLASLVTNIVDNETTIEAGFVLYGMHINPRILNPIFDADKNKQALT